MDLKWVKAIALAGALLGAAPAAAQYRGAYRGGDDVLRLQIGAASLSSGYYCGRDAFGNRVCGYSPFSYGAFVAGAEYDMASGRGPSITLGARLIAAGAYNASYSSLVLIEPSIGVTWKFGGLRAPVVPRLEVGVGVYLGSQFGGALRLGGGIAFRMTPKVDLGMDVALEVGALGGYGLTNAVFTIGPEIHL